MGCYNCGSEEGTSTRLCPKCIAARNNSLAAKTAEVESRRRGETSARKLISSVVGVAVAAAILICAGFYFLFSEDGPGILLPKYAKVKVLCNKIAAKEAAAVKVEASKEAAKAKEEGGFGAELADEMPKVAAEKAEDMSSSFCEMEIEECKKDSGKCDAVIERLEKELKK